MRRIFLIREVNFFYTGLHSWCWNG